MAEKFPDFRPKAAAIAALLRSLPNQIGTMAVQHFQARFQTSEWEGHPWPDRKRDPAWPDGDRTKMPGRRLLVNKGHLRNSIKIVSANRQRIIIGSSMPYAEAHNEGFSGEVVQTVKAHTRRRFQTDERSAPRARQAKFVKVQTGEHSVKEHTRRIQQNIPRRQFMGHSDRLMREIDKHINTRLDQILSKR